MVWFLFYNPPKFDIINASKIRQLQDCKGIPLPNHQEVKISQFADDTTLIVSDTNSLKIDLHTVDNFGAVPA